MKSLRDIMCAVDPDTAHWSALGCEAYSGLFVAAARIRLKLGFDVLLSLSGASSKPLSAAAGCQSNTPVIAS
jgi:hypothetical protein